MSKLPDNLIPVDEFKGGKLYQNPEDNRLWFVTKNERSVHIYSASHLDYITEWGNLDLKLDKTVSGWLKETETIHDNRFPARCIFKDGTSSDYCFIVISDSPPDARVFDRNPKSPEWLYLNQVTEIHPSPKALPGAIIREMKKMKKKSDSVVKKISKLKGNLLDNPKYPGMIENTEVVVKDNKGNYYKFSDPESFVYENYIDPLVLQVVNSPSEEEIEKATQLSPDRNEYERKDYHPPVNNLVIYADK